MTKPNAKDHSLRKRWPSQSRRVIFRQRISLEPAGFDPSAPFGNQGEQITHGNGLVTRWKLGQIAVRRGDRAGAGECYRTAVGLLSGVGQDRAAAQLWLELGAELEALGDTETALDSYRRAAVATGLQLPAALQLSH